MFIRKLYQISNLKVKIMNSDKKIQEFFYEQTINFASINFHSLTAFVFMFFSVLNFSIGNRF